VINSATDMPCHLNFFQAKALISKKSKTVKKRIEKLL